MSWNEAKKLSDVVVSNVVPSDSIYKEITNIKYGDTRTIHIDGAGIAFVCLNSAASERLYATINVDGNSIGTINRYGEKCALLTFYFGESFDVSVNADKNTATSVGVSALLFDRSFIGGGRVISFLPFRKAVAA